MDVLLHGPEYKKKFLHELNTRNVKTGLCTGDRNHGAGLHDNRQRSELYSWWSLPSLVSDVGGLLRILTLVSASRTNFHTDAGTKPFAGENHDTCDQWGKQVSDSRSDWHYQRISTEEFLHTFTVIQC